MRDALIVGFAIALVAHFTGDSRKKEITADYIRSQPITLEPIATELPWYAGQTRELPLDLPMGAIDTKQGEARFYAAGELVSCPRCGGNGQTCVSLAEGGACGPCELCRGAKAVTVGKELTQSQNDPAKWHYSIGNAQKEIKEFKNPPVGRLPTITKPSTTGFRSANGYWVVGAVPDPPVCRSCVPPVSGQIVEGTVTCPSCQGQGMRCTGTGSTKSCTVCKLCDSTGKVTPEVAKKFQGTGFLGKQVWCAEWELDPTAHGVWRDNKTAPARANVCSLGGACQCFPLCHCPVCACKTGAKL